MPKGKYTNQKMATLAMAAKLLKKTQYKYKRPFTEENIKRQHKERLRKINSKVSEMVFSHAPAEINKDKFIKQEKQRFKNKLKEIKNE